MLRIIAFLVFTLAVTPAAAQSSYVEIGYDEFYQLAGSASSDHAKEVKRVERIAIEIYNSTKALTRSHARNWLIGDDRGSASFSAVNKDRRGRLILLMKLNGKKYKSISEWQLHGGLSKLSTKNWERME